MQVAQPGGGSTFARDIALAVSVNEANLQDPDLGNYGQLAWISGTAGADGIDASEAGAGALLSAGVRAAMQARAKGVWIDGGAGDDTVVGSGFGDVIRNGAGNAHVDGGANAGGQDVFEIAVGSVAALDAIKVQPSDDPAYTWMVTYGTTGQKDYLKNVEAVSIYVEGGTAGRWVPLVPQVTELPAGQDPSGYLHLAWAQGTALADTIDAETALSAGAKALMAQHGRGMFIDTGAGDDVVKGTAYGDNIVAGAGVNRVDGGANLGSAPGGAAAVDVLEIYVASRAEAGAVAVTALDARATGADAAAWAAGYRYKVANGSKEIDYVRDIERVDVRIWTDKDGDGMRDYADVADPANEIVFARSIDLSANKAPTFAGVPAGVMVDGAGAASTLLVSATVLASGKLLSLRSLTLADGSERFVMARNNADGSVDTTFGGGTGRVDLPTQGVVANPDPLELANGKLLVAVSTPGADPDFRLLRLNADGSLDTSYGNGGSVVVPVSSRADIPLRILQQADGKVVVTGYAYENTPTGTLGDFMVAVRLNADGTPDTGFGNGGRLVVSQSGAGAMSDAVLQPDGKLLAFGYTGGQSSLDLTLMRFTTDGAPDPGFGKQGMVVLELGAGTDNARSVVVLADGKLLVAGTTRSAANDVDGALVRLNPDGSRDTGFGSGGIVRAHLTDGHDVFSQAAVQADGKIVVLGTIGAVSTSGAVGGDLMLTRYNADGSVDGGFGIGGILRIPGHGIGVGFDPAALVLVGGKILVFANTLEDAGNTTTSALVARVNADGTLDATFNPAPASSIGGTVRMNGVQPAVLDNNGAIHDAELAARGHYGGATLVLERQGGASADDIFVALGEVGFAGGRLVVGGIAIGSATQSGGKLTIVFDTNASQGLVNRAMHGIGYANGGASLPASVTIDWVFSDGGTGAGGALAARASTTVQFGATVQSVGPDQAANYDFVSVVTGSARADAVAAGLIPADAQALMAARGRGAYYDMRGGGGDTVAGTGYSDLFVMGAGTNYVDGDANAGSYPYGGNGMDELNVYVTGQAAVPTVTRLGAGATGADAQAHAQGYQFKIVAGAEVDYVKNVERLQAYRWNDANGNGVRDTGEVVRLFDMALAQFVREVRSGTQPGTDMAGNSLSTYANIAWVYGSEQGERFDAAADVSATTRALMDQFQRGVAVYAGAGNDTIVGSGYGDEIDAGPGVNYVDGGANAGTMTNGREAARDQLNVYVADAAAAAAVRVTPLDAGATGADAAAYAQGYAYKVVNGAETDYVKNVERVTILRWTDANGNGVHDAQEAAQYVREQALALYVNEIGLGTAPGTDAGGQPLANAVHMAWAYGGAGADRFDAATDVSAATRALMDQYQRGLWVDAGAGDDTIAGSAYGDHVNAGAGTNYVDGGANAGPGGYAGKALDVLEVTVRSAQDAAAVRAVVLEASMQGADGAAYAAGYRWKVVAGAETDYVRNVESVNVLVWNDANGDGWRDNATEVAFAREIALAARIDEVRVDPAHPDHDAGGTPLASSWHFGWARGSAGADDLDAARDVTAATLALMAQYGRGIWGELGAGDDRVVGSAWGDNISLGKGVNYYDGGANGGATPDGYPAVDVLEVDVASKAEADAVAVTRLTAGMTGADGAAYAEGYVYKVTAPGETDYVRNVEQLSINIWTDKDGDGMRDYAALDDPANEVVFDRNIGLADAAPNAAPSFAGPAGTVIVDRGYDFTPLSTLCGADGKLVTLGVLNPLADGYRYVNVLARNNADGSVDTGFGQDGLLVLPDTQGQSARMALLADGRLLVAYGSNTGPAGAATVTVVRYNADGSVDTGFGQQGATTIDVGSGAVVIGTLLVAPDGDIVAVTRNQVLRLQANGAPDTGFDGDGKLALPQGAGTGSLAASGAALQADGKLVLVGAFGPTGGQSIGVVRIGADGSLDTGFGNGGSVAVAAGGGSAGATAMHLFADGSMLVAGNVVNGTARDTALVKLTPDGSLDATFGNGGKVLQAGPGADRVYALAVQADGRIVVAGESGGRIEVVRYLADGSVDTGFGAGGHVLLGVRGLRDYGVALVLDGDKIVVMSPSYFNTNADSSLVLARLNPDGSLDAGFGAGQAGTLGGTVQADGLHPVVLDRNVTVHDADLAAGGSYAGAVLTVARQGGADAGDRFSAAGDVGFADGVLAVDGVAIGTAVQSGGQLVLAFGAGATQDLVNRALHGIAWSHPGAQPGTVDIAWRFSDDGSDGAGHVASGVVTVAVGVVAHEVLRGNAAPDTGTDGRALASIDFFAEVHGTAGADALSGALLSEEVRGLMAQYGRGARFATDGGDDTVQGTAWSDEFHIGAGSAWIDGGANGGTSPYNGQAGFDTLIVYARDMADAQSVTVTGLLPSATGADAQARALGYEAKVVHGNEIAYVRNLEVVAVHQWTDSNGNGIVDGAEGRYLFDVPFHASVGEIQVAADDPTRDAGGNPLAGQYFFAWIDGGAGSDNVDAWARLSDTVRARMDQYQRGAWIDLGAGDDAVTGTRYLDNIVGGRGTNWIDGGDDLGTTPDGGDAADMLEVYVGSVAERDAVAYTVLGAGSTGLDALAFQQGYRIKLVAAGGAEVDYLKNVENLKVGVWIDRDQDGVRDYDTEVADIVYRSFDPDAQGVVLVGTPHP
ncbi:hypothetical protein [uncultured Massilia sp.]|uniref:hypothetical protein n=1 Tax=uncultured Massilia sp. TaxID=169973 RepID=UPI0025E0CAAA|nr:hypothetical protein [uncultured Massilia sp.]